MCPVLSGSSNSTISEWPNKEILCAQSKTSFYHVALGIVPSRESLLIKFDMFLEKKKKEEKGLLLVCATFPCPARNCTFVGARSCSQFLSLVVSQLRVRFEIGHIFPVCMFFWEDRSYKISFESQPLGILLVLRRFLIFWMVGTINRLRNWTWPPTLNDSFTTEVIPFGLLVLRKFLFFRLIMVLRRLIWKKIATEKNTLQGPQPRILARGVRNQGSSSSTVFSYTYILKRFDKIHWIQPRIVDMLTMC